MIYKITLFGILIAAVFVTIYWPEIKNKMKEPTFQEGDLVTLVSPIYEAYGLMSGTKGIIKAVTSNSVQSFDEYHVEWLDVTFINLGWEEVNRAAGIAVSPHMITLEQKVNE